MEKNKLIEKFWIDQGGKPHMDADLWFYEGSWDMLMPVVDKIADNHQQTVYHWELTETTFSIHADKTFENLGSGIGKVYETVVEFIEWYNEQTDED